MKDKKCIKCGEVADFYWEHDGIKKDLCFKHYEELEKQTHQIEKRKRTLKTMFHITGSRIIQKFEKCGNGNDCKYCKELGLN